MLKKIKKILSLPLELVSLRERLDVLRHMEADNLAMTQINRLLGDDLPFLPITEYSLRPYTINHLLNEITINKHRKIVEFGTGISTIIISQLIKKCGIDDITFYSIDHSDEWQKFISKNYKIDEQIKMIYAPLTNKATIDSKFYGGDWYDIDTIKKSIKEAEVDFVLVDGPPAITKHARFPAVDFIKEYLSENGVVIVDDISREGEMNLVKEIEKTMNFKASYCLRHALLKKDHSINTVPFGKALYK